MTVTSPLSRCVRLSSSEFVRQGVNEVRNGWKAWVVLALQPASLPFMELRRKSGWSETQRNLLLTLVALEQEGIVERLMPGPPSADVRYGLTPLGAALADLVAMMNRWVQSCEIRYVRRRFLSAGPAALPPLGLADAAMSQAAPPPFRARTITANIR